MIRKFIYYLILTAVVFSCVTVQVPAFADEATEDYTDITHSLSNEQRNSLSDYLCRFGACYVRHAPGRVHIHGGTALRLWFPVRRTPSLRPRRR